MRLKKCFISILFLVSITGQLFAQTDDIYASRRHKLLKEIGSGVAVIFSQTSADRLNKHFYYLTGIEESGSALILIPDGEPKEILFNRSASWKYAENNSSSEVYASDDMGRKLGRYIAGKNYLYVSFADPGILNEFGRSLSSLKSIKNIDPLIVRMRIYKDKAEIDILKKACQVTAEGLNDTYKAIEPGLAEKDLKTFMEYGFERRGSPGISFLQAASGPNSTSVHAGAGERKLEDGDMIVFDVGAYWDKYTADISRSVPVSGKFTKEQKEIYQVVLNSQKAAIKNMIPGKRIREVQQIAENVLIDGLYELGLILDKNNPTQRRFFIAHGFYHFIGLDVHDVWYDYKYDENTVYEPGMIMTMEPGLYFPSDKLDISKGRYSRLSEDKEFKAFIEKIRPIYNKYINIGVRIEDDILVTKDGNIVLTKAVPKEIVDIEKMMREKSPHNKFEF